MEPSSPSQSTQQNLATISNLPEHINFDFDSMKRRITEVIKYKAELHQLKIYDINSNSIKIKESRERAKLSIEKGGEINLLKKSLPYLTEEIKEKSEQLLTKRQSETDIINLFKDILLDGFLVKPVIFNHLNIKLHATESTENHTWWILNFKFSETFFLRTEFNFTEFKLLAMNPQPENFSKIQILLEKTNDIAGLLYNFKKYLDHISNDNYENV